MDNGQLLDVKSHRISSYLLLLGTSLPLYKVNTYCKLPKGSRAASVTLVLLLASCFLLLGTSLPLHKVNTFCKLSKGSRATSVTLVLPLASRY